MSFDQIYAEPETIVAVQHPIISFQLRAEGETWALKFARLRKELLASGGKDIPQVYLSAELAMLVVAPVKTGDAAEIAAVPGLVPLDELPGGRFSFEASIKYIADLFGLKLQKSERGYLLDLPDSGTSPSPR